MTRHFLPARPNLVQLKRQAKERLEREPSLGRLRDAQRAIAVDYGFDSWDALRHHVEAIAGAPSRAIIKPDDLDPVEGEATWTTLIAAVDGDVAILRDLLARNPRLSGAEYWYTPAIHFVVREGHAEAVRLLLDAGADPERNGLYDGSLIAMANDRGHSQIARLLEEARDRRHRIVAGSDDHPVHAAITRNDIDAVRALLDADPTLVNVGSESGASPLHRAVGRGMFDLVVLLVERGASVQVASSSARGLGSCGGFWGDLQPIDIALWHGVEQPVARRIIRFLLDHGATYDLTVAAALGDIERVTQILDTEPARIREARPSGRRPLSAAVEAGHDAIARLLLERGADPTWPEPTAPQGRSLHAAARAGNFEMVKLLLAHGADPNSGVDSSGNAMGAASSSEIRVLLESHGATMDPYETTWIDNDAELKRVATDPGQTVRVTAGFVMVVSDGRRDRLERMLAVGMRVPPVVTGCQTYLLTHADMLRTLLAHGMTPDVMNWQRQTLLHHICRQPEMKRWISSGARDAIEKAAILLDAGANIVARDEEYRSTPLAWASRSGAVEMVRFLLSRGAPTTLPDDEPWATPMAWAERRQHPKIVSILRQHGADR
ncbi:MAG: ankyrin repeat domain-containing protein [Vicinamibacterales bacterium]